jgi:rare lipoprotein A (peptidoglycan hydrolase)
VRIAELTDRVENTQADVVGAQLEQARLEEEASSVRARVRARAVAAYIHGHDSPDKLAAPTVYLQVRARKERDLLARYRTATNAVLARRGQAEAVQRDLRAAGVDLDSARRQLDALVAADDARLLALQQAAEQRAAADARRRAVSATASAAAEALARARNGAGDSGGTADLSGLLPRHKEATRKQAELMQRYPFGVLAPGPLPGGLRSTGQAFSGAASWYGGDFNGRPTASGAIYDMDGWTAASRTLPLGTMVVVSRAGVRVLLLVNDRGPYVDGRVLDLSAAAARALNVGVSDVDVEVVQPAG